MHIIGFQCVGKIIEKIDVFISYLVNSWIWLNLPMDDCHFDCKQKFLKKENTNCDYIYDNNRTSFYCALIAKFPE